MGRPLENTASFGEFLLDLAKRSKIVVLNFVVYITLDVFDEAPQPRHPAA